jgi:YggT family protein
VTIICTLLFVYFILLLVRVFSSWFPIPPSGPVHMVISAVFTVTEPVLRPVRGLLPPLRMGAMGLDLSPIIVFIVIGILRQVICRG